MDFGLLYQLKNKTLWISIIFYASVALLITIFFGYSLFAYKYYLLSQEVNKIDIDIASYGTLEQKTIEKEVLDYEKKVGLFAEIINKQKISSNIFSFIEQNTLPDVWFYNFGLAETSGEIKLSGETTNLKTISRQIEIFENKKEYVKEVSSFNTIVETNGAVKFSLSMVLSPEIFNDAAIIQ